MNYSRNKNKFWQNQIKDEEAIYSKISPKTSSGEVLDTFLSNFIEVYDKLWSVKLEKKRARLQFKVYCLKRKKIDSFLQSWTIPGEQKPYVLYGASKFKCTGKGEKAVPVTYVAKRCAQYYKTEMVDEYCTTKVCCECNERSYSVTENGQSVRGLRWCSSTNCRRFFDRDLNAALNILRCPASHGRPNSLSRDFFNRLPFNEKLLIRKQKTLHINGPINDSTMTKVHSS
jgi:transposase